MCRGGRKRRVGRENDGQILLKWTTLQGLYASKPACYHSAHVSASSNYSPWGWSSHNTKCCAYTQKYKWMGELENNRICAGKTQCTTVFRSNPTVMARGGSRLHTTIRPFHLTPERLGRTKEKKRVHISKMKVLTPLT